ncbi:MAG: glycosyltransferase [Acidobacteriota bacterium]
MPRINVMILNDHIGYGHYIHGAARLFRLWAMYMNPERYSPMVCILREKTEVSRAFEEQNIGIEFLGKGKFAPTTLPALLKVIRRKKINLMHVQAYGGSTFGRIASLITGVPAIVHFHDTNPYYPLVQRITDRLLAPVGARYLAVSSAVRDFYARRCGLDAGKMDVLYNCYSADEFQPASPDAVSAQRQRLGIPAGYRVVGTVTRLHEEKGNRYFVEAMPRIFAASPKTAFLIVGDGPLRADLEKLAAAFGVGDHVKFTGYTEDVASILGTFDVSVMASIREGGSPLPVIEAMAMGKPVVVTDLVEIVEDGVAGFVVPPSDPEALAERVLRLLKDPDEASRMGQRALQAAQKFTIQNYMRRLEAIYDEVLASRRRRGRQRSG